MGLAPCVQCERKGCGAYHDQCEIYLEWKKEHDVKRQKINESVIEERMFISMAVGRQKRNKGGRK